MSNLVAPPVRGTGLVTIIRNRSLNADFQCSASGLKDALIGADRVTISRCCKDHLPSEYWYCLQILTKPYTAIYIDARDVPGLEKYQPHQQERRSQKTFAAGLNAAFSSVAELRAWAEKVDAPRMEISFANFTSTN